MDLEKIKEEYKKEIEKGLNIYYSDSKITTQTIIYLRDCYPSFSHSNRNILLTKKEISNKFLNYFLLVPISLQSNRTHLNKVQEV